MSQEKPEGPAQPPEDEGVAVRPGELSGIQVWGDAAPRAAPPVTIEAVAAEAAALGGQVEEILREVEPEFGYRRLAGVFAAAVAVIAGSMSLFHLYTARFGLFEALRQRSAHVAFVLALVFLLYPLRRRHATATRFGVTDVLFAAGGVALMLYLFVNHAELARRAGNLTRLDLVIGVIGIVVVLEAGRRVLGVLPFISLALLAYPFVGQYLPGLLAVPRISAPRVIEHMFFTTEGIFGIPVGVSASFVFLFVLMGAFLERSGLGQLFVDIAIAIAGWMTGGPAKVSVLSSAFIGTVSGSSVANVVTDGVFNIPLMKRLGYSPTFAAGVEAATSVGGQLMPPVMGAAAFVMAEFLGVPYLTIVKAAALPAIFYYLAMMMMIHFEAKRLGLRGLPRSELPSVRAILIERGYLVFPLVFVVGYLLEGFTPMTAAFWGIMVAAGVHLITVVKDGTGEPWSWHYYVVFVVIATAASVLLGKGVLMAAALGILGSGALFIVNGVTGVTRILTRRPRMDRAMNVAGVVHKYVADIWGMLVYGARNAIGVATATAVVGIIIGVVTLTGLGLKFVSITVALGQQNLFFTLVLVAVACTIIGSGIPTTATYIILAAIAAPAVAQLGVLPIAAHLFIFYFGVIADLTPPDALAAYAAAGIARSDPFRTGLAATRIALAGIIVPFAFVYSPALLLQGAALGDILVTALTAFIGIIALAAGASGYLLGPATVLDRVFLIGGAVALIFHDPVYDVLGVMLLVLTAAMQRLGVWRRTAIQEAATL